MANKSLTALSLGLCILGLIMTCVSVHSEEWAKFDTGTDDIAYGLLKITDGPDNEKGKMLDCIKRLWCTIEDDIVTDASASTTLVYEKAAESNCAVSKGLMNGIFMYLICNLVGMIFLIKYMVSCISIMMNRDPGHRLWMFICSLGFGILSFVGFGGWWGLSGVSYSANCDDREYADDIAAGDKYEMCAGTGATISIISVMFMILAGITGCVNAWLQKDLITVPLSDDKIYCLVPKIHYALCLVLLFGSVAFGISAMVIKKWVNTELGDTDYDGSLYALDSFNVITEVGTFELDNYGYSCIAVPECDQNDDLTGCKTFEPLMDASRVYMNVEMAVLIILLTWNSFFLYSIFFKREFGHPMLNHALPHLAWVLQLVAIASWAVMSEVEFKMDDCENDELAADEKADICVTSGPVISVVQLLIQIFLAVYFSLIYYKRGTPDTRGAHVAVASSHDKTEIKGEEGEGLQDETKGGERKHVTPI